MQPNNLPIGYWIKTADEMLTKGINAIQASLNITRTSWQLINTLYESASPSKADLINTIQPFADTAQATALLAALEAENIITATTGNGIVLTEKGQKLHRACLEKQQAFRQHVMAGISNEDYQTTVQTLRKITENSSTPET